MISVVVLFFLERHIKVAHHYIKKKKMGTEKRSQTIQHIAHISAHHFRPQETDAIAADFKASYGVEYFLSHLWNFFLKEFKLNIYVPPFDENYILIALVLVRI